MILRLAALPPLLGPPEYKNRVPLRFLQMAPDAASALVSVEQTTGGMIYTDIFRSAQSSLEALRAFRAGTKKAGVKPPGFSGHGFGLSFDVDVGRTLRKLGVNYPELRELLEDHGFFCHRRDLESAKSEGWHFNYLSDHNRIKLADPRDGGTWDDPVEAEIQSRYGNDFQLGAEGIRSALGRIGYSVNPAMGAAIRKFQGDWGLTVDGDAGPKTQRTLAYVAAEIVVEPIAA